MLFERARREALLLGAWVVLTQLNYTTPPNQEKLETASIQPAHQQYITQRHVVI